MDDIIRRIIRWKERAKWAVRHDHSNDGLARILQEGVNLGHELEDEWLKTRWPDEQGVEITEAGKRSLAIVRQIEERRRPDDAAPTGGSHERHKATLDG